jgi:hypothetical protein
VIEVPRRQSTGPSIPRDVVAEVEEVVEGVFEDETENGIESGVAIELATTSAGCLRSASACSILWFIFFIFMVHPKFSQIAKLKIPHGPAKKINEKQRARRSSTRGRKISFASSYAFPRCTNASIRTESGCDSVSPLSSGSYHEIPIIGPGDLREY